jgi:uncharacterized membrane protein YphA (DoxX/SURF4 family)
MRALGRSTPPERWLAYLRIGVGLWFAKSLFTKLGVATMGGLPLPTASERWMGFLPIRLAEYADGNGIALYRDFLREVAIPHADVFSVLTAFGESAVGVGLVLGLLTPFASAAGAFLALNYLLASYWMGPSQQGFHLLLILCMAAFMGGRAGRCLGLDGVLARRPLLGGSPGAASLEVASR